VRRDVLRGVVDGAGEAVALLRRAASREERAEVQGGAEEAATDGSVFATA